MKLLKWLSIVDRFAKMYLDSQLAPLGLNSSQHMYVLKVCTHPGILQDSLIESFYVHPSNIVRTVYTLEKKGFLTRTPYPKDKRTWCLHPTQKALWAVEEIQKACDKTEDILQENIDEKDLSRFHSTILQMGEQITSQMQIHRVKDEFDE